MTNLRFNYRWAIAAFAVAAITLAQSFYPAISARPQSQRQPTPTPTPTPEKKLTIEDIILRRDENQITVKPEFEVVMRSANGAVVRKKSAGTDSQPTTVVVAEIDCLMTVKPGCTSGRCKGPHIGGEFGTTVTCTSEGCVTCKPGLIVKAK